MPPVMPICSATALPPCDDAMPSFISHVCATGSATPTDCAIGTSANIGFWSPCAICCVDTESIPCSPKNAFMPPLPNPNCVPPSNFCTHAAPRTAFVPRKRCT